MTDRVIFSDQAASLDWPDAISLRRSYGPKAALLTTLPRLWTPPFVLLPASVVESAPSRKRLASAAFISRVKALAGSEDLIIRSSVLGESIWDRGRYTSEVVKVDRDLPRKLNAVIGRVVSSTGRKRTGLVIQRYIDAKSRGEFGNLQRISKTRDHWELSTVSVDSITSRTRFNAQRDEAAAPDSPLEIRSRVPRERLFGSIAAWLNNVLLRGRSQRLTCEWVTDNRSIYLVQIDEEDEDIHGVNPFQIRIPPAHHPAAARGKFLNPASGDALHQWDKLRVLDELWEPSASHRPTLFYACAADIAKGDPRTTKRQLANDFRSLIGRDNIVVRTSVRAGRTKTPNLPRTECLTPEAAASWCLKKVGEFRRQRVRIQDLAFVAHRFVAARASAWVRAEPGDAVAQIDCLWGLPDALQFFPYDIWEVHLHTEVATDYPEYKSTMLTPRSDGVWEYVRVKNELARSLCIGRQEAIDLATRTAAIAHRLGRACHVMWFVGCTDQDGAIFSLPWYWTEAHEAEKNIDRSNYNVLEIGGWSDLNVFKNFKGSRHRQAVELKPTDPDLTRDTKFIEAVGTAAVAVGVPVILAGSTLAHAYYQLRRQGCTVVARGEKDHSRVRQSASFGKVVRDKIPARIAQRGEAEVTRKVPDELLKGFLTGKLMEEALEVRNAKDGGQKMMEMADLYEVVRALARAEGISLDDIVARADEKKEKAGGFDHGLVLLHTGILGRGREALEIDGTLTQVLARKTSADTYEIPFSFFGFMELDQPRSLDFDVLGIRLTVRLKADRVELQISKMAEQLQFPLDRKIPHDDELRGPGFRESPEKQQRIAVPRPSRRRS